MGTNLPFAALRSNVGLLERGGLHTLELSTYVDELLLIYINI